MPHLTGLDLPLSFYAASAFVLGLIFGSFLNVVIYRVPRGESIVYPGSHCGACGAPVKAFDNIPLLSFAARRALSFVPRANFIFLSDGRTVLRTDVRRDRLQNRPVMGGAP